MIDWLPDLTDPTQWRVVSIKSLNQQQRRVAIPAQEFTLSGAIATAAVDCFNAPVSWTLGGWATSFLGLGGSRVQVDRQVLTLGSETLIVLPKSSGWYALQVSFPRWLPQARIIVREFIGVDLRPSDLLDRVERKIDALNP